MFQSSLGKYVLTFLTKADDRVANLIYQVLVTPCFKELSLLIPDSFIYISDFVFGAPIKNGADVFLQERENAVLF